MTAGRARINLWLKVAVLVVMMLATIGAWEVYKGVAKLRGDAYADNAFNHLKCYQITPGGPPVNQVVTLFDQFYPQGQDVTVRSTHLLCVPAAKQTQ